MNRAATECLDINTKQPHSLQSLVFDSLQISLVDFLQDDGQSLLSSGQGGSVGDIVVIVVALLECLSSSQGLFLTLFSEFWVFPTS